MDKIKSIQLLRTIERHVREAAEAAAALAAEIMEKPYSLTGVQIHPDDKIVEVTEHDEIPFGDPDQGQGEQLGADQGGAAQGGADRGQHHARAKKGRKDQ